MTIFNEQPETNWQSDSWHINYLLNNYLTISIYSNCRKRVDSIVLTIEFMSHLWDYNRERESSLEPFRSSTGLLSSEHA